MAEFEDFFDENLLRFFEEESSVEEEERPEEEEKTVKDKDRSAEYKERTAESGHRKKRPQRWKLTLPLSKNCYVKKLSKVNWRG